MSLSGSAHSTDLPEESECSKPAHSSPTTTRQTPIDLNDPSLAHLSKNQLKRLRKQQQWDAGLEQRKEWRNKKRKEKRMRDREARRKKANSGSHTPQKRQVAAPITFIIDTAFDHMMKEGEVKSLSVQVNRCYSCIRRSSLIPILALSSFGGRLKEHYNKIQNASYKSWTGVKFCEDDVTEVGKLAVGWMKEIPDSALKEWPKASETENSPDQIPTSEEQPALVYLSADSPNLLTSLSPNTAYVIGGLVDKNRYKGHCQQLAEKAGIATARLPITEYVHLSARKVLTVNHVIEIMTGWLETGDWEKSFLKVIPQRTGIAAKEDGGILDEEDPEESSEDESQ
jgi:tRNA (guanine9-N1)-methyltransferase